VRRPIVADGAYNMQNIHAFLFKAVTIIMQTAVDIDSAAIEDEEECPLATGGQTSG
jgi:hypothetical protein